MLIVFVASCHVLSVFEWPSKPLTIPALSEVPEHVGRVCGKNSVECTTICHRININPSQDLPARYVGDQFSHLHDILLEMGKNLSRRLEPY